MLPIRTSQALLGTALAVVAMAAQPRAACADVDLNGRFQLEIVFGSTTIWLVDIVQSGTTLTMTRVGAGTPTFSGTIDPVTGAFNVTGFGGCNSGVFAGTATSNDAFIGTWETSVNAPPTVCQPVEALVIGTRSLCDSPAQQCAAGSACCSDICTALPSGTPCSVDGNACTAEACDGAGSCNVTGPRSSGTLCRAAVGPCDQAETCDGVHTTCPADQAKPDGTGCNDANATNFGDHCAAGVCVGYGPFKCYKATDLKSPKFAATTVALSDQFGVNDGDFTAAKPSLLCNPTDLNGLAHPDPAAHLACYKITGPRLLPAQRPHVEAGALLGTLQLQVKQASLLCLPSAKTILP